MAGHGAQPLDLTGQRFNRLVAVHPVDIDNGVRWLFQCDCGQKKVLRGWMVATNKIKSCGCLKFKHGLTGSGTYQSWQSMRTRCRDNVHYIKNGISVCERWGEFTNFLADMGERPDGMSIDRIDNSKGYEPGNCRWATTSEQVRNRKISKLEPHEPDQIKWLASLGYSQTTIAKFYGVTQGAISNVIRDVTKQRRARYRSLRDRGKLPTARGAQLALAL